MKKNIKRFEFKIVAGSLKGRVIKAPDLGITRPPLTRLRKSIFDFLNPYLDNADYLDLFSGTGSYLFEAASRNVRTAYGVEMEPKLAEAINSQAQKFNIDDKLRCYCEDVFHAIPRLHEQQKQFDIIMIAPPQYKKIIDDTLLILKKYPIIKKEGILLCQHDTSEKKIDFHNFEILQKRKYGNTTFTILKIL